MWKTCNCNDLSDLDLYLKIDMLISTDIFRNYTSITRYPVLVGTDLDVLYFFKNRIRVNACVRRKSNSKYVK